MRADGAWQGGRGRGEHRWGGQPRPHPSAPVPEHRDNRGSGQEGQEGQEGAGTGGGRERGQGEEQKIQSQVGGNPIQSNPNQNFKPYLRCLTSGEPDLGKGKGRKKERKKKKEKKERKGERNKEKHESSKSARERGEKSFYCHNLKTLFNL